MKENNQESYKYQLFPPLAEKEYKELKQDIQSRGVQVPIEYDEDGNILDGHHRLNICKELGITDYSIVIRYGMSEAEKLLHIRMLNLTRRHLSEEQKKQTNKRLEEAGQLSFLSTSPQEELHCFTIYTTLNRRRILNEIARERPDLIPMIHDGKKTIEMAYSQIQRAKQPKETTQDSRSRLEELEDWLHTVFGEELGPKAFAKVIKILGGDHINITIPDNHCPYCGRYLKNWERD